ncbi:MAG: EamA family transporter [Candidatus Acidiferrales bacterium]
MNNFRNAVKESPSRARIVLAFLALYFLWGATYYGIKVGIETIPPFLLAGARHTIAGLLLFAWLRVAGVANRRAGNTERLTLRHWAGAAALGALMLFGGNGGVTWSVQYVPSGIAAVIIALMPLWLVLLDWLRPGGVKPGARVMLGLVLGFAGIVLLVGPERLAGGERVHPLGAGVLILASLSWAIGSLLSRSLVLPRTLLMGIALQSIAGGALILAVSGAAGEWARFEIAAVSARSLWALAFLVACGSIVGLTSYIWLLRVTTAAHVATYAYVNPAVALALGWMLGGESFTARSLIATAIILSAVVLIVSTRERQAMPESAARVEGEASDLGCVAHVTAKAELATEPQRTQS